MHGLASPCFSERPFRSRPDGSLRKFPRRLGQFPLSFPSTLGGAPLFQQWRCIVHVSPAVWSGEWGEVGKDGTLATVEA